MLKKIVTAIVVKIVRCFPLRIRDTESTLHHILKTGCSVARYGDGEIDLICHHDAAIGFQKNHPLLREKLRTLLMQQVDESQLIICLPYVMYHPKGSKAWEQEFWPKVLLRFTKHLYPKIDRKRQYYDTECSRPYTTYGRAHAERMFKLWKQIWDKRPLLLVEGSQTRMGVGNDLFDNAQDIHRILIPATNAFDRYDEILENIVKHYRKGQLVLLAAGPTATVLAFDLAQRSIQAIDTGHLDVQYSLYEVDDTEGFSHPIPGKYVNESGGYTEGALEGWDEYLASIVADLS